MTPSARIETTMRETSNQLARTMGLLSQMHVIRAFEYAAEKGWKDGRIYGSVHLYIGEEAIAVGVCANLRQSDYLASYHRGHGHSIAKGADPIRMMKELFGRADGICGGKGGSMHVADFSVGMLGANGVVGDGAAIAVGAGLSIRLRGEDRIAVAFIGDGAVNRGPFMEALNWAQVYALPVLFVCEDNAYASSTRTSSVTGGTVIDRARSFGMVAEAVDGNDIFAVDRLASDLVQRVRAGNGPALVHAKTYRWYGHTTRDDGSEYRDAEEVARFRSMDPIARCEGWLEDQGIDVSELDALRAAAAELIERAVTEADAAAWPAAVNAYHDVQDVGAPTWPK